VGLRSVRWSSVVSGGLRWSPEVSGGFRRSPVVSGGLRHSPMVSVGLRSLRSSPVVTGGPRWTPVVFDGLRCSPVPSGVLRWSLVVSGGLRWFSMVSVGFAFCGSQKMMKYKITTGEHRNPNIVKNFFNFFFPFFPPLRSFQWSPVISVVSICEWGSLDYIETILERHTQKRISVESDDEKIVG